MVDNSFSFYPKDRSRPKLIILLMALIGLNFLYNQVNVASRAMLYLFFDKRDVLIQKKPPIFLNELASFDIYDEQFNERRKDLTKDIVINEETESYSFYIIGEKRKISEDVYDNLKLLSRKEFLKVYTPDNKVFIVEQEGDDLFMYTVAPIRYAK